MTLDPSNTGKYIKEMRDQVNSISSKITEAEKEIYGSISKFGKSLDKVSIRLGLGMADC